MGAYIRVDAAAVRSDVERVFTLFPRLKERRRQTAGTLSGGEQQMLAMGRALMSRPALLLMDEPSMGLAPLMVQKVFETVRTVSAEGVTILLIEQNAKLALVVSHRGYVMAVGIGNYIYVAGGIANSTSSLKTYRYDTTTNTWDATFTNRFRNDPAAEESWVKLPDGSILSYDITSSINTGVGHAQPDDVTRVHQVVPRQVGHEVLGVLRVRGRRRHAILGDEREVHRFRANGVEACGVVELAGVHILREGVDVQRGTPLIGSAADAGRPRRPARRIELHLQERGARVMADVVRSRVVPVVEDVRVAVRDARGVRELRGGLVVAQRHPEPEGRVELEVPGPCGAGLVRHDHRIAWDLQVVETRVARARLVRIEQQRGLVVARVLPAVADRIGRLGTEGVGLAALRYDRARRAGEHPDQHERRERSESPSQKSSHSRSPLLTP